MIDRSIQEVRLNRFIIVFKIVIFAVALLFVAALQPAQITAGERKPITATDLWLMKRVGSLRLSPDGRLAAVTVMEYDIDENSGQGDIWLVNTDGSGPRRFTTGSTTESSPAWSPDGTRLAFISRRDGEKAQLQVISVKGGEAIEYTDMSLGVSDPRWLPCGRKIVFSSKTLPGLGDDRDGLREELKKRDESKVTAKVTEDRYYRYWDHWLTDGYVSHLYVIDLETGEITDLMPEWEKYTSNSGGIEYDIAPDGEEIAFTAFREGPPYDRLETDIYLLDVSSPGKVRNLTADNPADDFAPHYTPDGKYILYGKQKILGFYGDRVRLVRYNRRTDGKKVLTGSFDRSPSGWVSDPKSRNIYFSAEDRAMVSIFTVGMDGGEVREIYRGGANRSVDVLPGGGLIFLHQSSMEPNTVCVVGRNGGSFKRITSFNYEILAGIEMGIVEDVTFTGAEGEDVQMFILYPPGFDPEMKYPLLVLVHGGPHGTFGDVFHPRWNTQVFAAPGYVTAMVNFHGSSSFGQDYTDAITGENGRKPFIDVMKAVDYLVGKGFVAEDRMAVAGGSYGGYLASWIGTQTDRFACLINHAGVFDLCAQFGSDITSGRSRAYGGTPWDDLEKMIRWSPAHNMKDYVTPTLVIHGEKDYRVPVGNGLEAYGMLKAKGVPARFIYFPDENHWVLTPQNSVFWYKEFHAWLDRWIGTEPE